jgi:DNA-binding transcriptional ArsR family regulator
VGSQHETRCLCLPRQQVGYHLRELEKAGLVELVEERRKGNCIERIVRAAGRCYVVSPEALGKLGITREQRGDRFDVGFLVCLAARAIRDLTVLCGRADKAGKRVSPTTALDVEVRFGSVGAR